MVIDLHCHSTASDGSESPETVVDLAAAAGLTAVALTDHDGLAGLARAARRADELGIGFVPGCEVSCSFEPGSMHVLCYFIEDTPGPLQDGLDALRKDREHRNSALIERLEELGIPVSRSEVEEEAGSSVIGRPHFAAVLVRHGVVASVEEAFNRYLAKDQPGYVGRDDIEVGDVLARTAASGGVAVLAHPLSLGLSPDGLDRLLAELSGEGLSGLECEYANYDPATRADLAGLARARPGRDGRLGLPRALQAGSVRRLRTRGPRGRRRRPRGPRRPPGPRYHPVMDPFPHISYVSVPVGDPDRAIAFYRGRLGFELIADDSSGPMRWVALRPPAHRRRSRSSPGSTRCRPAPSGASCSRSGTSRTPSPRSRSRGLPGRT